MNLSAQLTSKVVRGFSLADFEDFSSVKVETGFWLPPTRRSHSLIVWCQEMLEALCPSSFTIKKLLLSRLAGHVFGSMKVCQNSDFAECI